MSNTVFLRRRLCKLYRGNTTPIIIQRIAAHVDKLLREERAGFRRGRGCIDQIFTLRNIIEQRSESQRQLYINFVDFEKAFDSIHRDSLWHILRHYGIPRIVSIIQCMYVNFTSSVGKIELGFEVKTGVRQGCVHFSKSFQYCH